MSETIPLSLSTVQKYTFKKFADRINKLNADFYLFDLQGNELLSFTASGRPKNTQTVQYLTKVLSDISASDVMECSNEQVVMQLVEIPGQIKAAAVIDFSFVIEHERVFSAGSQLLSVKSFFEEIILLFKDDFESFQRNSMQIELVSTELAQTYEELVLLYNMSTNMKVTQSNATYLQLACDQITQMVNVEGIAIFLEKDDKFEGRQLILTAGSGVVAIDPSMADILHMYLTEEVQAGKEALLDSNIDGSFKYNWPERINNIVAVPLNGNDKMIGFLVATNIIGKADFDSVEIKLFNSVANQCAVFIENGTLFTDLKDLFIGSLKALTNSIDAKDQYTRGHSERVAFIARWIADRYSAIHPLEEDYIHKIYLAGLLHDIGKIGIDELVLRKNGKLTDKEHGQIKSHPKIGATILSDIKQMKQVVPGILHHHERFDGKGYPDGLKGTQSPLMARIIGLADAFDAMTSKRVYRDAMNIDKALDQIHQGLGSQFDPDIAQVFIQSDIKKLWSIIQDGFIENWDYSNFGEYGAEAVGTLLR